MEPNNLYRGPNPSIQSMKAREMVDQQAGGESSSKDYALPVDPSSKCAFDHLTDIEMGMGVTGHENGEEIGVVIESVKPRVRLPVMTQGIFNSAAITQLQDELEDVKRELDKQKATSVPSKDEIILPKRMSLPQLMEIFPAVGDQINAKMDQKLSDAHKEHEMKFKTLQDEYKDELLRIGAVVGETESRLHDAEEKLRGLAGSGQRCPNESFGNALLGIQNSHGPARNTINSRQDPNPAAQSVNCQAPQAFVFGSPTPLTNPLRNNGLASGNSSTTPFTNPFRNNGFANSDSSSTPLTNPLRNNGFASGNGSTTPFTNPFRNNRWTNGDGKKRGCDEAIQPEFGRDVKRVKR
ncbi:hypothetical protein EAF00_006368 [Botryotinia globosa]|nr:hypothetical protein EAF00_006368 [Botryotinia globosa]